MRIIVAEDEPLMQKTIALRLRKDGHEVITTDNGREALELIATQNPDLVITDIMMPYASGLEIVGSIRSSGRKLPIIVLTAMGQENVVLEAFQLGADDFIAKPFSPNELSMRVKRLMVK